MGKRWRRFIAAGTLLVFAIGTAFGSSRTDRTGAVTGSNTDKLTTVLQKSVAAPGSQQLPTTFLGGVIEGYYGKPWSPRDASDVIAFIGQHHMNTFVYAPKDDPYQRAQWRNPYPQSALTQLKALVDASQRAHVQFVYSISPGLSISYGNAKDRALLIAKVNQVRSLGVHVFMLSLDDIYHGLEGTDWNEYHGDMAFAQSSLANQILRVERAADPKFRLVLTPTTYHGMTDNAYWDSLRVHLNSSVPVIWTGPGPGALSAQITAAQVRSVQKFIGHPIIIWDNYPVNDYTYTQAHRPQLFLGPVVGRSPDLVAAVAGYLYNPMIQARASEVALWTGGDYLYNPTHYRPQRSETQAIHSLGGSAWSAFRIFVADSSTYYREDTPPIQLATDENAFWKLPRSANLEESALWRDFVAMERVDNALKRGLPDQALYAEIQPWSALLTEQGQAGIMAIEMLARQAAGKSSANLTSLLRARLNMLNQNPNIIAGNVVSQFIERALQQVK